MVSLARKATSTSSLPTEVGEQHYKIVQQMRQSANACTLTSKEWQKTLDILLDMMRNNPNFINDMNCSTMIADDKLGATSSAVIEAMNTFLDGLQTIENINDNIDTDDP